jgi:hypothetical protein
MCPLIWLLIIVSHINLIEFFLMVVIWSNYVHINLVTNYCEPD